MTFIDSLPEIGRHVEYYPVLARLTGKPASAVLLCYLASLSASSEDGWVGKTQAELEAELLLTPKAQKSARRTLKALGFIEERLAGSPPTVHFKINDEAVCRALVQFLERRLA